MHTACVEANVIAVAMTKACFDYGYQCVPKKLLLLCGGESHYISICIFFRPMRYIFLDISRPVGLLSLNF